jgi:hypothetical protein
MKIAAINIDLPPKTRGLTAIAGAHVSDRRTADRTDLARCLHAGDAGDRGGHLVAIAARGPC